MEHCGGAMTASRSEGAVRERWRVGMCTGGKKKDPCGLPRSERDLRPPVAEHPTHTCQRARFQTLHKVGEGARYGRRQSMRWIPLQLQLSAQAIDEKHDASE